MYNEIFCEMKGKKVIHWGGGPGENGGTVQIASWKCNFGIYFDIQVYYFDIQVYYFDIQVYYLDIQAITTLYSDLRDKRYQTQTPLYSNMDNSIKFRF